MMQHPYIKYAQALLMVENNLQDVSQITAPMIQEEVQKGFNAFSLKVDGDYKGKKNVKFVFSSEKNEASKFNYLAPNIISTDKHAKDIYNATSKSIRGEIILEKLARISQTEMPMAGEFCSFTGTTVGRGKPSATEYERLLSLITSLTPIKPCLQYISGTGKKMTRDNVCIIPDMSLSGLVDFIKLFKRIRIQQLTSDLLIGKVKETNNSKKKYEPSRPLIYRGNFPNPPFSSALGSLALLGAIGEMTKEEETSSLAKRVINELKEVPLYMIKYGDSSVFSFNHCILQLAGQGNLRTIVDSLYWCSLYKEGPRNREQDRATEGMAEYEKFDLFASRFMQSFNRPAFHDFLSFRAEYPSDLTKLFLIYFEKMEKIDPKIVHSARVLGQHLNCVAYLASNEEYNKSRKNNGIEEKGKVDQNINKRQELKAKALIEFESSIFSARSGDALIANVMTRAGRMICMDAPEEATLFIEKACSGELNLEQAKNLLIAFLRLKNKGSWQKVPGQISTVESDENSGPEQDFSEL